MIIKQVTTSASALPARPERPFKYVWPVTAPDGSVGYDRPLENYFDASMAPRLLPNKPPTKLYDTVARSHDHRYEVTPDMIDPSWSTPRPLVLNPPERCRSLANNSDNSPEYMGISPDVPGWHPRRSPYEDRRSAVGVTPSEVNTLVPYIPPIDTSSPPPSREWLDAMAKRFLADAHADFGDSHRNDTTTAVSSSAGPPLESDDSAFFDYNTDSTLDGGVSVSRPSVPQPSAPQAESEFNPHDADFNSNTDTDADTDTDTDSDDGYDWSATHSPPSGPGSQWLIPRKRPSVVIVNNKNVSTSTTQTRRLRPLYGGPPGKRRRGGKTGHPERVAKTPKKHENDTPMRRGRRSNAAHRATEDEQGSSSRCFSSLPPAHPSPPGSDTATSSCPPVPSITATALQIQQVRIASPGIASPLPLPQPHTASSVPPRSPKLFPCLLDGCTQVCASAGDLQRHQQSLRHRAPSYCCLACGKSYTRSDALKRHLNSKVSCKREHAAKLANEAEEVGAEANDEAVRVVATSSG